MNLKVGDTILLKSNDIVDYLDIGLEYNLIDNNHKRFEIKTIKGNQIFMDGIYNGMKFRWWVYKNYVYKCNLKSKHPKWF